MTGESKIFLSAREIGVRLRALREERNIAQNQLAAEVGMEPAALSRVETGKRQLAISELVLISERLDLDPDEVLLSDPDPSPLFRNDGGAKIAEASLGEMSSIVDDFLSFRSVVGG